jgi:hypothetical protein
MMVCCNRWYTIALCSRLLQAGAFFAKVSFAHIQKYDIHEKIERKYYDVRKSIDKSEFR